MQSRTSVYRHNPPTKFLMVAAAAATTLILALVAMAMTIGLPPGPILVVLAVVGVAARLWLVRHRTRKIS